MRKTTKKLALHRQTVRSLDAVRLAAVPGAKPPLDSVIVVCVSEEACTNPSDAPTCPSQFDATCFLC